MGYRLAIDGPVLRTVIEIAGAPEALAAPPPLPWPDRPNSATRGEGLALLWVGPARWVLLGPLAREADLATALRVRPETDAVSITVLSDTLAFFTLTGADADAAMAIACPLDLHPAVFGADGASVTDAFGVTGLVMRVAGGWTLGVEASFADYVATHLGAIAA